MGFFIGDPNGSNLRTSSSKRRIKEYITETLPNGKTRTIPVYESFSEHLIRDLQESIASCFIVIVIIGVVITFCVLTNNNQNKMNTPIGTNNHSNTVNKTQMGTAVNSAVNLKQIKEK
ncbi:MAG: hypothetical protein MUC29_03250 [Pyrinomonadaceae bacterium]|jgi:hypothetical protein|nr:hypothetical protein [Pyrinomonadaceae bacterium]